MHVAARPDDEEQRLEALQRYGLDGPGREPRWTELARLASYVTGARIGLVTAIGAETVWIKGARNLETDALDRETTVCSHLLDGSRDGLVVEDAREDPRFADDLLAVDGPAVRFYAGEPLVSPGDHVLGSVCGLGTEPGELVAEQRELLAALGRQAVTHLVARRRIRELGQQIDALART